MKMYSYTIHKIAQNSRFLESIYNWILLIQYLIKIMVLYLALWSKQLRTARV